MDYCPWTPTRLCVSLQEVEEDEALLAYTLQELHASSQGPLIPLMFGNPQLGYSENLISNLSLPTSHKS